MSILNNLPVNFFTDPIDLEILPSDVINELSNKKIKKFEMTVIELINAAGGTLSLDKIIVGFFLLLAETHHRTNVTQKLHYMMNKGLIFRVKGKKGIYTTLKEIQK